MRIGPIDEEKKDQSVTKYENTSHRYFVLIDSDQQNAIVSLISREMEFQELFLERKFINI